MENLNSGQFFDQTQETVRLPLKADDTLSSI